MLDLDTLLGRFGAVPEGDGWVSPCPAHTDTHPSLRLAIGRNGGLLIKCRAGCDTGDVLQAAGLGWPDVAKVAGIESVRRARSTDASPSLADIAALAAKIDAWHGAYPGSESEAYASRRFGVLASLADSLRLGHMADGRLVVPFMAPDGAAMGFQARDVTGTSSVRWLGPASPTGASWAKVGFLPSASGWAEVLVTEGPGDALTACAAGYDSVAVRGAALGAREDVADAIARYAGDRPVVVFGDSDDAGRRFGRELVAGLARLGASAVAAHPPTGDLTSWREADPDAFQTALVSAVRAAVESMPDRVQARLDEFTDEDLTDLGMAWRLRRAIEADGSGVRFVPEAGFYLLGRGGVWRLDRTNEVRTLAQESSSGLWSVARELLAEAEAIADPATQRVALRRALDLKKFAKAASSTQGINSVVKELEALRGVAVGLDELDSHPDLVAVRNGVLNLRTGSLEPSDPSLLLTRMVDIEYRPDATAPRWEQFLEQVFPDDPTAPDYIRRLVGYGLTGETVEQCFVVNYGTGANGKSVFTDTLTAVFREQVVTTPFSTFEQRPAGGIPNDLAALKGARFVMASEGEQDRPMAEAVLKRVTGRDMISARFMRQEFFEFRPSFLLMLSSNYRPNFRGQDEGLWRRVKLIEWSRYFAEHERDYQRSKTDRRRRRCPYGTL